MPAKSTDESKHSARTYGKVAARYAERFPELSEYLDKFISFLPPGGKVLDVGCGPGTDSRYLAERGFEADGIDLSKEMIKLARKRAPSAKFKVMDMRSLGYPDNHFDGMLVAYALTQIPARDTKKAVRELGRALKPNGIAYFSLHEGKGERFVVEPLDPRYMAFVRFFTMREIARLLRSNGFKRNCALNPAAACRL